MLFLKEATQYASTSKMDSANLAKIFAPTILRSPTQQVAQEAKDSPSATLLVQLMIDHYDHIFSAYPKLSLCARRLFAVFARRGL